eukprot:236164-Chlamydomonas_euryale.AAC.1
MSAPSCPMRPIACQEPSRRGMPSRLQWTCCHVSLLPPIWCAQTAVRHGQLESALSALRDALLADAQPSSQDAAAASAAAAAVASAAASELVGRVAALELQMDAAATVSASEARVAAAAAAEALNGAVARLSNLERGREEA